VITTVADNVDIMTRVRFAMQALAVLLLLMLVSVPEEGRLSAVSVWRTQGWGSKRTPAPVDARDRRPSGRRRTIGYGSASYSAGSGGTALHRKLYDNDIEGKRRFVTPDAVHALGGRINALTGRARTALNAPLPFAQLVLRNAATGALESRAVADENGEFTFLDVLPSGYVVELLGSDGTVVAASELVPMAEGDVRQTTVYAASLETLLAAFGTLAPTAMEPVAQAMDDGVSRVAQPERTVSPQR
jgi:hypothetical protein